MQLNSRDYIKGDYESHIKFLTKQNMEQLFIDNFGGWSDSVSEKKFFNSLDNGFVRLFFLKDVFVGYVSFNLEKDHNNSYMINDIHVVEQFQKQGYGTEILDYVINKVLELKGKQLRVFVFEKNPSLNFYKKNEFMEMNYLKKSNTFVMSRLI